MVFYTKSSKSFGICSFNIVLLTIKSVLYKTQIMLSQLKHIKELRVYCQRACLLSLYYNVDLVRTVSSPLLLTVALKSNKKKKTIIIKTFFRFTVSIRFIFVLNQPTHFNLMLLITAKLSIVDNIFAYKMFNYYRSNSYYYDQL